MSTSLALVARTLLAAIFLISGTRKLLAFAGVAEMMAGKGFPMAPAFLAATIALEIVGAVMLIANWHARYAAWALAAFTLAAGAIFHGFWHAEPAAFMNEFNHFLKNISIIGGLLLVAAWPASRDA